MKLGIQIKGFDSWGGGIDFIKYIVGSMEKIDSIEKHILVSKNDKYFYLKKLIYPVYSLIKYRSFKRYTIKGFDIKRAELESSRFKINLIGSRLKDQLEYICSEKYDIILPCITVLPKYFPIPWVGYIYDFQHKYLPEFFTEEQINHRNAQFSHMLNNANHVLVNAKSVKDDINTFIVKYNSKIHVIPFNPIIRKEWLNDNRDLRADYNITKPYFIISNQFWIHKDHKTAFKAFSHFISLNSNDYELICTGNIFDDRFPKHFNDLVKLIETLKIKNNVKILGYIPKNDQISLMKRSIAVIQPTLFEGGPGGGASYDAISLGVPLIISDIKVNREIGANERVFYFEAGNEFELTKQMNKILKTNFLKLNNKELKDKSEIRKKHTESFFFNLINEVLENTNP